VILGIFLVAFWMKSIKGPAVFWAAVIVELFVIFLFSFDVFAFLWLNVIGALLVILLSLLFQALNVNFAGKKS